MIELKNMPLIEGPIVTGDGVYGPLVVDDRGRVITPLGMATLESAKTYSGDVLVLDGPCRKMRFVSAESLVLAPSRKELGEV